jgi:RND family efflux transporter MFP subunit
MAFLKRFPIVGSLQIVGILAFIGLAIAIAREPAAAERPGGGDPRARATSPAPFVTVVHPTQATNPVSVDTTGTIVVRNRIDLTPQITGRVASVAPALRAGGSFKAGETLLTIERRDFDLALTQAEADVDAARASLLLTRAESDAAISNYAILNPGKQAPPLVAKTPQIEQAKAAIAAAEARRDIAALDLERTAFSLPFDGRVVASTAEIGQLLNKGQSFGNAFAVEAVEAVVPISPADLAKLSPAVGRTAHVSFAGRTIPASVARVSSELDERTRFAELYLSLDDQVALAPGTFVDVAVEGPQLPDTFMLPESAEQVGGKLWVVDNDQLAEIEPTLLARTRDGLIVRAFDTKNGLVVGSVPGGRAGLSVAIANQRYE